jgi:2-amino-4-hydroxy-6-hydroxymethyldihydropteridine diphosphokinase
MKVVIALGSNLGNREELIDSAIKAIKRDVVISKVSTLIETDPVGGPKQGSYLNGVLVGETTLSPHALMDRLLEIELELGRVRSVLNGPRTIDLDLIDYEGVEVESDDLTLPHPRAHQRAFVLLPWLEIEPEAELIGHGSVREIANRNGWL